MQLIKKQVVESQFAKDVISGLSNNPKAISSKYFYDKKGDAIFQEIMNMPEYYLTRCEFEIFSRQCHKISKHFAAAGEHFNLIEFGAGDGYKTKVLLNHLQKEGYNYTYYPVDISQNILDELQSSLEEKIPDLDVKPLNIEYFSALSKLSEMSRDKNIILFLGANIGNFHLDDAAAFLGRIRWYGKPGDMLLLGVDLKKDPKIITNAYNDPHGITARFNLNLLDRMNRELGADFEIHNFIHHTFYEPLTGEVLSYILSVKKQKVNFSELDMTVEFEEFETIHTEISKKYSLSELEKLASDLGFELKNHFTDSNKYFVDTLWQVK